MVDAARRARTASGGRPGRPERWLAWGMGGTGLALVLSAILLSLVLGDAAVAPGQGQIDVADLVGFVAVPVVGALLASRLPGNSYGWVWCGLGVTAGVLFLFQVLRDADRVPSFLPPYWQKVAFVVLLAHLVLVFLLFPTGRPPGRGWRWVPYGVALLAATAVVLALFAPSAGDAASAGPLAPPGRVGRLLDVLFESAVGGLFLLVLLGMSSVVARFRRAGSVERQQLKWFLLAALVNAVTLAVAAVGVLGDLGWSISNLTFGLLPVAVAVAVLRYRLYEIDRIVSRTVSYGVLTAGLLGLYVLVITLLGGLLAPVTGSSDLVVAASTLAVAAAFRPARRRVQAAVDRRFDRARYDAARTVDAYAQRLRRSVDLDDVTAGLREAVGAAVAPERVSVWLRDRPAAGS